VNYENFINDIKTIALEPANNLAATFIHGWTWEINAGTMEYDVFLMFPTRRTNQGPRINAWLERSLTIYFLRQNETHGREMTEAEKITAWSELEAKTENFINILNNAPEKYQISSRPIMEQDEGHVGNDLCLWLKITFNLNIANC
jgi:hypothetical protein